MIKKQTLRQIGRLVILILVTLILGIIAVYRDISLDVTLNQRNSLSPESRSIAASITQPVHILAFTREDRKKDIEALLQRYHRCNYRITFTLYNPDRRPQLARDYHISAYGNLILQTKQRRVKIQKADEISITNGLLGMMENQKPVITIIRNQSDNHPQESPRGLERMKAELEEYHIEVRFIPVYTFPDSSLESDLVIIPQLSCPFDQRIMAGLDSLIGRRIPFLLMLEPGGSDEQNRWLNHWGIQSTPTPILDPQTGILNPEPTIIPGSPALRDHPITAHLSSSLYFSGSVALFHDPSADRWHSIISSSNQSYLEQPNTSSSISDLPAAAQGPFCIALIHQPAPSHPACLIVGDADFCTNSQLYNGSNLEFLKSSINFLIERQQLLTITHIHTPPQSLELTSFQQKCLFFWIVIALPAALAITGFIYLKYRKGKSLPD